MQTGAQLLRASVVKLVDTADLKSAAFLKRGVPVRFRFEAPRPQALGVTFQPHVFTDDVKEVPNMRQFDSPYEIHVHGEVLVQNGVDSAALEDALSPLWRYAGARSFAEGAQSHYEEEPGIAFDAQASRLQICWTVCGDEDFRQVLNDLCMNLNELSSAASRLEISFYDAQFDEEDADEDSESNDDFFVLFVGPTPAAIMQAQRDLLVQDVVQMMERHFEAAELGGVVAEIDKLFTQRFEALVSSLELGRSPGGSGRPPGHGGGGRRPRHLH